MEKTIKDVLFAIFHPSYWHSNYRTSDEWDRRLNQMIDQNEPVELITGHRAVIGGHEIWIENYPYAYGHPVDLKILPKRRTRKKLADYLEKSFFATPRVSIRVIK